jgi:hypothetical protein
LLMSYRKSRVVLYLNLKFGFFTSIQMAYGLDFQIFNN